MGAVAIKLLIFAGRPFNAPPQNRRRNPNKSAEQIGGPIFQRNRFPVPWISVPGPKHTSLLVAL